MSWLDIGTLTFRPDDTNTVVGSFLLGEDHDSLWVKVTSETPPTPWPWSYGILGFRSSAGYELGTVKAYSDQLGEVFRLGVGLPPVERSGFITFEPRSYNLAWVRQNNPWTLTFQAQSGILATPPLVPSLGIRATLGVFADLDRAGVSYAFGEDNATIRLSPR